MKIKQSAKNYTGASPDVAIPSRVKGLEHTVMQVSRDGKSVLLKEIYSWAWVTDVDKA